jgi:hypothetical protein
VRRPAIALIALLALGAGASNAYSAVESLTVRTVLRPDRAFFGDPVTAEIDVAYDARRVDAGKVTVRPDFAPYTVSRALAVQHSRSGSRVVDRYRFALLCVEATCVPTKGVLTVRFAAVEVQAGGGVSATAAWKPLAVYGRVRPGDLPSVNPFEGANGLQVVGLPSFRRDAALPPLHYRLEPRPLVRWLTALAAVLAAAAISLVAREVVRSRRLRRGSAVGPLETALRFVRESAQREPSDRRKALELLAEELDGSGQGARAGTAARAAWRQRPPSSSATLELADEVERAMKP